MRNPRCTNATHSGRRQRRALEVHTRCARRDRDIQTIVHDDPRRRPLGQGHELRHERTQRPGLEVGLTHLEQVDPRSDGRTPLGEEAGPQEIGVTFGRRQATPVGDQLDDHSG